MGDVICCNCDKPIKKDDEVTLSSVYMGVLCHRACNDWQEQYIFDNGLYWHMKEKHPDYFYFVEQ